MQVQTTPNLAGCNVYQICWIYFVDLPGGEPGENLWKEEALKRKLGRRMDKHSVCAIQSGSIRFLSSQLEALLTAPGFLLVRKVTLGDPAMLEVEKRLLCQSFSTSGEGMLFSSGKTDALEASTLWTPLFASFLFFPLQLNPG